MLQVVVCCPAGEMINHISLASWTCTLGHFAVPTLEESI